MNILDRVISVKEASELWGLSPGTIKNMCAEGHVLAKKIGPTWAIDSAQPTPVRRPARVEHKKKAADPEADPNQITVFDMIEELETPQQVQEPDPDQAPPHIPEDPPEALEPDPAPLDPDDVEYFGDLYHQAKEWDGLEEAAADDRLRAILAAYEFAAVDQERILALIKEGERADGDDRSLE